MKIVIFVLLTAVVAIQPVYAENDGKKLYQQHCAVCHGYDGQGGVGLPLSLQSFLSIVPESYLINTIKSGRPGRVMPSFPQLSGNEISAIAKYIISWHKGERVTLSDAPVRGDIENGAVLYTRHCAKCHGNNGEGGAGTGVTFSRPRILPIIPPALNNEGFLAAASDQFIKMTLIKGRKNTPMKSFTEKGLSENQINDIVAYVRSFQNGRKTIDVEKEDEQAPILIVDSPNNFNETVENVKQAIVSANFLLIRVQSFDHGLVEAKKEDNKKTVIYFCNFNLINKLLKIDPRIGSFLPCRITITEQSGQVKLQTINPKILNKLFNNDELNQPCDEMAAMYKSIMEDSI